MGPVDGPVLGPFKNRSEALGGGAGAADMLPLVPKRLVDAEGEEQFAGTQRGPDDFTPNRYQHIRDMRLIPSDYQSLGVACTIPVLLRAPSPSATCPTPDHRSVRLSCLSTTGAGR
jgi:hypothetical protein